MKITLTDAGKRFNREWIFRHLNYTFITGSAYAITGPNGSGKSTLLQVIAGSVAGSEGGLRYENSAGQHPEISNNKSLTTDRAVPEDDIYRYISIAAPYMELVEEMTCREFLSFHQKFKSFLPGLAIDQILSTVGLLHASDKQVRYYSSGMKQRLKLAQAVFTDTPVVLLDEPCTNLDNEGIALYHQLIDRYCTGRLLIISSNDIQEYSFCKEQVNITAYKP